MNTETANKPKWSSTAGPIQTKRVNAALTAILNQRNTVTEITGTHGLPETEHKYDFSVFGGGMTPRPDIDAAMAALAEKYQWTVTAENHKAIIQDAEAALPAIIAARPVQDKRITMEEHQERLAASERSRQDQAERLAKQEVLQKRLNATRPSWAKALIIAVFQEDQSDSQSDHFSHKSVRTVAIGWRSGSREDFRQLRQAAAGFESTKHLGPGCELYRITVEQDEDGHGNYFREESGGVATFATEGEANEAAELAFKDADPKPTYHLSREEIEHRENYSMGAGNYLKAGSRHSTGWCIQSVDSWENSYNVPAETEIAIPERAAGDVPAADTGAKTSTEGVTVKLNAEKNGVEVQFPAKPAQSIIDSLKRHGFRWTFKDGGVWYHRQTETAIAFAYSLVGGEQPQAQAA